MHNLKFLYGTKLSQTEYNISQLIEANISTIIGMSITEIAEFCSVSPSKITKYCKKLGLSGYKELQYELRHKRHEDLNDNSPFEYQREKILSFFSNYDQTKIEELISLIDSSEKVYFYGRGPSLKVAEYFAPRLHLATSKSFVSNYDEYLFDLDLAKVEENKLMVVLTVSGKTQKIHEILKLCKSRNIRTVVISGYVNNILERESDLYINLLSRKERYDRRIIRGRTLFYIYLEILTQELMDRIYD
ncbi:MAG: MurR/RpiR family transcriptional regulator [Mycoplasmatales bacterium]